MGIRVLRLDAVAFLWKEIGTNCIHRPETHEVVKLFRDILEIVAPETILLTETNVPHEENISYFGSNDEAHMVYQFALPPLLLHGLLKGTAAPLTTWASGLPELGSEQAFLNFTSSHDGIGMRPLTGLLPDSELDEMIKKIRARGGRVSTKSNADGTESPYELNITYASALSEPGNKELGKRRFLCSQMVALCLQGIPAVYLPCLFGALNDEAGVAMTGRNRSINREKWDASLLEKSLGSGGEYQEVFHEYLLILRRRGSYSAFHPNASQKIHSIREDCFIVERGLTEQTILCISNFSPEKLTFKDLGRISSLDGITDFHEIITGKSVRPRKRGLPLGPYQTVWLLPKG